MYLTSNRRLQVMHATLVGAHRVGQAFGEDRGRHGLHGLIFCSKQTNRLLKDETNETKYPETEMKELPK